MSLAILGIVIIARRPGGSTPPRLSLAPRARDRRRARPGASAARAGAAWPAFQHWVHFTRDVINAKYVTSRSLGQSLPPRALGGGRLQPRVGRNNIYTSSIDKTIVPNNCVKLEAVCFLIYDRFFNYCTISIPRFISLFFPLNKDTKRDIP